MFEGPGGLVDRGRRLEELGVRYDVPGDDIEAVRRRGWRWKLDRDEGQLPDICGPAHQGLDGMDLVIGGGQVPEVVATEPTTP
jgi:hypothetical protein